MTPEIQAAINSLIIAALGALGLLVTALGVVSAAWLKERQKNQELGKRLRLRQGEAVVGRETLFNTFSEDCLKRVNELEDDLRDLRKLFDDTEKQHETDRSRWIGERNGLSRRIEELEGAVRDLVEEKAERELVVSEQSEVIRILQQRVGELEGRRDEV